MFHAVDLASSAIQRQARLKILTDKANFLRFGRVVQSAKVIEAHKLFLRL
jgi:hypothetical protein